MAKTIELQIEKSRNLATGLRRHLATGMQDIKGRIRATLAKDLHNGQIQISLRKAEAEEVKPILSKREIFDDIRKSNPAVEKLRTLFDLQLTGT